MSSQRPVLVPLTTGPVTWAAHSVPFHVTPLSPWFADGLLYKESHHWGPLSLPALRQHLKHLQPGSSASWWSGKRLHILAEEFWECSPVQAA